MNQNEFEQCLCFIEKNLKEKLTLDEIALQSGYSRFHFCRDFKKFSGVSTMKYVTMRKLISAAEEIKNGRKIIDVALDYQFTSHSCFTMIFKREIGFHPSLLKFNEKLGGKYMEMKELKKEECIHILMDNCDHDKLYVCLQAAEKLYAGEIRYSQEEYITHPLNTAVILVNMEANEDIILAGLFCDCYEKGREYLNLKNKIPQDVWKIVEGLNTDDWEHMSDEVLMVRTAARLHNMQTLSYMPIEKQKEKAEETLFLLSFIRKRVENFSVIEQLSYLSVQYL